MKKGDQMAGTRVRKAHPKKLKLEVGKTYENEAGDIVVKICERDARTSVWPFHGEVLRGSDRLGDSDWWTEDGKYGMASDDWNLFREYVPATPKKPVKKLKGKSQKRGKE